MPAPKRCVKISYPVFISYVHPKGLWMKLLHPDSLTLSFLVYPYDQRFGDLINPSSEKDYESIHEFIHSFIHRTENYQEPPMAGHCAGDWGLLKWTRWSVDLFLPSKRFQLCGEDWQINKELQGNSKWFDRSKNRMPRNREEGVKTGIIGSECNTEVVSGFTVLWERTDWKAKASSRAASA